ncbi:MAG: hypothetical protein E6G29_08565 [Actinobacteria bacterium]|nr:MAG: hypothetical protein E6G29_08565 [Actinomycetota bacterium]
MKKGIALLGVLAVICGCGTSNSKHAAGHPANVRYVAGVDNPWYPLEPGTTLIYRGVKDGKPSRDVLTVCT